MEGTLATFDEDAFITDMADILDIDPNTIDIVSTAEGSVIVVFRIFDTPSVDSTAVVDQLQTMISSNDTALASAGIVVLNIHVDTSNSAAAQKSSDSGLSTGGIVAIAVVIPIASIVFAGIAVVVYRRKRNLTSSSSAAAPSSPGAPRTSKSTNKSAIENDFWKSVELGALDHKTDEESQSDSESESESDEDSSEESSESSESESDSLSESETGTGSSGSESVTSASESGTSQSSD